ncbi:MAG: hypothetical protein LUC93_00745 [Planctomycetaceae bacterium]|nr:hypothetical protein [Planctomycetaceae bacterium]
MSPSLMVFMWFDGVIMLCTDHLWQPITHQSQAIDMDFSAALFTAVSAACVTGLSVVNVHNTFTHFGQAVIFLLMEMGGMGIMTFASLGFRILGRRLSLTQQAATTDAIYQNDAASEFKRTFLQILKVTIAVQAIGAVVMAISLVPQHWHTGERGFMLWSAAFHSVSAFCNSGFTLYRDDLYTLVDNIPFLVTLLCLVTLGGLGHSVLHELYRLPGYIRNHVKKPYWISLHTRVVLNMTVLLIVVGIVLIWVLGSGSEGNGLWHAVFATVSGRTAGFSISRASLMPLPSIIVMLFLMFVGGSPGSCAGGIKTTSLAIWIARIKSNLRNDTNVNMFGYTIAPELVSRARILMAVTMIWNVLGVFIMTVIHPDVRLEVLIFEQISAFGTVGLSMDFTPSLTTASRLWISISMFVGRLGPLSIALWVVPSAKVSIHHPIGRVMVG